MTRLTLAAAAALALAGTGRAQSPPPTEFATAANATITTTADLIGTAGNAVGAAGQLAAPLLPISSLAGGATVSSIPGVGPALAPIVGSGVPQALGIPLDGSLLRDGSQMLAQTLREMNPFKPKPQVEIDATGRREAVYLQQQRQRVAIVVFQQTD